jgi:hypothetical protein
LVPIPAAQQPGFIFTADSNPKAGQRVYWLHGDDTENTGLSSPMCRYPRADETQSKPDETTLAQDDNVLKLHMLNQAITGSDKQTGPKWPK